MRSSLRHSTNLKGPVPTGFLKKSGPCSATAAGLTAALKFIPRVARKVAFGSARRTTKVESSAASIDATMSLMPMEFQ